MPLERPGTVISPNNRRVVLRSFDPAGDDRELRIIARLTTLSEIEVDQPTARNSRISWKTPKAPRCFHATIEAVRGNVPADTPLTENRRLQIGALFTQEYALESAAPFNPTIVWHPDQSGLAAGSRRYVLSLRATGEGHISSVTFRSGVVDARNKITVDAATHFATTPDGVPNSQYEKGVFRRKLVELGLASVLAEHALARLKDKFTLEQLERRFPQCLSN